MRHKEDPNSKIGAKTYGKNEIFYALNGISFEVRKGEALGIIGGNGAGKSTTLKLISQVTAPTKGKIYLNGRITSMLEVGTGFHPELTGRENIYLNGAILGMTKAEIDSKIEEIIDFSECRQFIDTPVKRYSSGMYVKLAFSVAAHLDSEIMIMDEVLAVGDVAFQQKCIEKMISVVKKENKTILYVSHNMNTIRQLCNRCIVLKKGKVIFEGEVEKAIQVYMENYVQTTEYVNFENVARHEYLGSNQICRMQECWVLNKNAVVFDKEDLKIRLKFICTKDISDLRFRIEFGTIGEPVATSFIEKPLINIPTGEHCIEFGVDADSFIPNIYETKMVLYTTSQDGTSCDLDAVNSITFEKISKDNIIANWNRKTWGRIMSRPIKVVKSV